MSRLDNLLRRAARAAEELDAHWLKQTTLSELRGLEASVAAGSGAVDPEWARFTRARVEARRRLALPHVDCSARRPGDCVCLTGALIEAQLFFPGLERATKDEVLARSTAIHRAARERGKPRVPRRRALPQARPEAEAGPTGPPKIADAEPTAQPESKPKPLLPSSGPEPAHPLSWSAFKRRRDGTHPQTAAEIRDTTF